MIFDPMSSALYADDGSFIKTVYCPMALTIDQLSPMSNGSPDRHCHTCKKDIRCIDDMSDADLQSAVSRDADLCVFATPQARNIVRLKPIGEAQANVANLPVIKTARNLESMADAHARGFTLVLKETGIANDFGEHKYLVYKNLRTGALWWSGDFRSGRPAQKNGDQWEHVKTFWVRPDRPFPLAAYLVPPALQPWTRVFLEDVIEDVAWETWNQGNARRMISLSATWDGSDFHVAVNMPPPVVG